MAGRTILRTTPDKPWNSFELDQIRDNAEANLVVNLSKKRIAFCSDMVTQLTGYSPQFIFKTSLPDLLKIVHPNDRFDYLRYFRRFCAGVSDLTNGQFLNIHFRIRMRSGQWLRLCQKNEVFDYEDTKMLVIQLSKRKSKVLVPISSPTGISHRELEVLKLIGSGFSSKEIARRLNISSHTAISHRKNLIEKFNVRNTAHLIREAYQLLDL